MYVDSNEIQSGILGSQSEEVFMVRSKFSLTNLEMEINPFPIKTYT